MSRTFRPRSAAVLTGVLSGALLLGGCSAGQIAATAQQVDNSGGADVTVGSMFVRNAQFVVEGETDGPDAFPAGGSAALQALVVNEAPAADQLVSATSPVGDVAVSGTTEVPGGQTLVVSGEPAATADEPETDADGTGQQEPDLPEAPTEPQTTADGERSAQIVITDLAEPLRFGLTYDVVLVFEQAGEIRVPVPVNVTGPRLDSQ